MRKSIKNGSPESGSQSVMHCSGYQKEGLALSAISQVYRQACRDINLPLKEKKLFLRLLREISVNSVRRQKAWNVKEHFLALWFISAGTFPELALTPYGAAISDWVCRHLTFELTEEEKLNLWI